MVFVARSMYSHLEWISLYSNGLRHGILGKNSIFLLKRRFFFMPDVWPKKRIYHFCYGFLSEFIAKSQNQFLCLLGMVRIVIT